MLVASFITDQGPIHKFKSTDTMIEILSLRKIRKEKKINNVTNEDKIKDSNFCYEFCRYHAM